VKINDRSLLANLIDGVKDKFSKITVSYFNKRQLIIETLRSDLEVESFKKIEFFKDVKQTGTAVATLDFAKVNQGELAVLNGDTMYSHFDFVLPKNIANNEAVICTSKQIVNRSGIITYCQETGLVRYTKNRHTSSNRIDYVNNGIILLGKSFIDYIGNCLDVTQVSLESLLLDRQGTSQLQLKTVELDTQFIDFGDPDTYENAVMRFKEFKDATTRL